MRRPEYDYAKELILIGVMLSKGVDSKRVRNAVRPELFVGGMTKEMAKAIQEGDADKAWDLFAPWGVQQHADERVIESILRGYLQDRKQQIEEMLASASKALESEINRPTKEGK